MWNLNRKSIQETPDEKKVRSSNFWYILLVAFIVLWMTGAYIYLDKKTDVTIGNPPVIVLDAVNGIDMTNFFRANPSQTQLYPTNNIPRPMFEVRENYNLGDVVVVKYFYVEAVVLEKQAGDSYVIMYKDHNHTLQKIAIPRTLLMYPADGVLNPVSLLVD